MERGRSVLPLLVAILALGVEAAVNDYNFDHFEGFNQAKAQSLLQPYQQQVQAQPTPYRPQPQQQQQAQQQTQFGGFNTGAHGPSIISPNVISDKRKPYKPIESDLKNPVLDRFSYRYPDGSYEFRYELADGSARYERGYFLLVDKAKTLVVVGYYSYRTPDGRYITVFYNADQNGYRQNQSITPQVYPNLPRSIEVPQFKDLPAYTTTATTPYPRTNSYPSSTTPRREHF